MAKKLKIIGELPPGQDGFSPTVEVSEIEGGKRITITDANGEKNVDVMNGIDGAAGEKGEPGIQGIQGIQGIPGVDGSPGKDGQNGVDGQDGKSAYDIAVENGYTGSAAEWLASLKGEKGNPGEDGQPGAQGSPGYTPQKGVDYFTDAEKKRDCTASSRER